MNDINKHINKVNKEELMISIYLIMLKINGKLIISGIITKNLLEKKSMI